jgi:hypothetical protein
MIVVEGLLDQADQLREQLVDIQDGGDLLANLRQYVELGIVAVLQVSLPHLSTLYADWDGDSSEFEP